MNIVKNLNIGDRIVVPKSSIRWVQHHAIYMGYERGQHWMIENKENVGVQLVTTSEFFKDVIEITRIERFNPTWMYSRRNLKSFALSKVGDKYSLLNYNCESFANLVQYGKVTSDQVSVGVSLGLLAIAVVTAGFALKEG